MNATEFIFKKYSPQNKRKFINEMSRIELLNVDYKTIERCIKEAGHRMNPEHTAKSLMIDRELASNCRNSNISYIYEGKIYRKDKRNYLILTCYIQGDDIDTEEYYSLRDFLDTTRDEISLGSLTESFRGGYSHTLQAYYDRDDRANVIKAILLAYIDNKYKNN